MELENTKKRNQHFVPRFYLKKFSIENNLREIRVFNLPNKKFISRASLADQAASKFYYGKDGELEDSLSKSEGIFAGAINKVLETNSLPPHQSKEHRQLLHFAIMTEERNPMKKRLIEKMTETFGNYLKKTREFQEAAKGYNVDNLLLRPADPVVLGMLNHNKAVAVTMDLFLKLLVNNTDRPFITSDNPVVQYNQFLEKNTKRNNVTGYAVKGLEIFVPLTDRYMLMFYDSQVYYVGSRRSKSVTIANNSDVDQLNMLQILNCISNVYGNEKLSEAYILGLFEKSIKFPKANEEVVQEIPNGENRFTVLHETTSCQINLSLSFSYFSTHAARFDFKDNELRIGRNHAIQMLDVIEEMEKNKQRQL
jgi:Protein of unknown function (DUF4238)